MQKKSQRTKPFLTKQEKKAIKIFFFSWLFALVLFLFGRDIGQATRIYSTLGTFGIPVVAAITLAFSIFGPKNLRK